METSISLAFITSSTFRLGRQMAPEAKANDYVLTDEACMGTTVDQYPDIGPSISTMPIDHTVPK